MSEDSKAIEGWWPGGVIHTQRTPQIPWWHLQLMRSARLGESLSSKTWTSGCDQQTCPGTFPSSWPFVKNLLRTIVQDHPRNGGSRRTRSRRPRRSRPREAMMNGITPNGNPSSWSWQQPMTWASSSSSSWQQWSSDQMRERSDWQPSANWSNSDQSRERARLRSSVPGSHHSYGSEE